VYFISLCVHKMLERQQNSCKNYLLCVELATFYLAENLLLALKFSP
jgi:hypothetical protein